MDTYATAKWSTYLSSGVEPSRGANTRPSAVKRSSNRTPRRQVFKCSSVGHHRKKEEFRATGSVKTSNLEYSFLPRTVDRGDTGKLSTAAEAADMEGTEAAASRCCERLR